MVNNAVQSTSQQMLPPGGQLEIVFSFDTTGSMSECLDRVRAQLTHVIERLFADIPGLRIAVFAHGDYCDFDVYGYVTKHIDFTNDVAELCRFVGEVEATGGGDFEECYELVLRQVREQLSWQPGSQRALVMIGDATPHAPDSEQNVQGIDWRQETSKLKDTHIYAVQCLNNGEADSFYRYLAEATGGRHLQLDEFTSIVDIIMAICYMEKGAEFLMDFEQEVHQRDGDDMRTDVKRMFLALHNQASNPEPSCSSAPHDVTADVADDVVGRSEPDDYDSVSSVFISDSEANKSLVSASSSGMDKFVVHSNAPAVTPISFDTGSVTSSRLSVTSGRSSSTSGSTGSKGSRHRSSGVMTRSRTHPMKLRQREPLGQTRKYKRQSQSKKTPSQRCFERVLRERQHGAQFILSDLSWSRWQCAMTTAATPTGAWEQRPGGHPGDRRRRLYDDEMTSSAAYEFAVQVPGSATKTPVLGAVTQGFRQRRHWEAALLTHPLVSRRLDDVLRKGCKLYIRRASVRPHDLPLVTKWCGMTANTGNVSDRNRLTFASAVRELRSIMGRVCDYAWRPRAQVPAEKGLGRSYTQRQLSRKGIVISG